MSPSGLLKNEFKTLLGCGLLSQEQDRSCKHRDTAAVSHDFIVSKQIFFFEKLYISFHLRPLAGRWVRISSFMERMSLFQLFGEEFRRMAAAQRTVLINTEFIVVKLDYRKAGSQCFVSEH